VIAGGRGGGGEVVGDRLRAGIRGDQISKALGGVHRDQPRLRLHLHVPVVPAVATVDAIRVRMLEQVVGHHALSAVAFEAITLPPPSSTTSVPFDATP